MAPATHDVEQHKDPQRRNATPSHATAGAPCRVGTADAGKVTVRVDPAGQGAEVHLICSSNTIAVAVTGYTQEHSYDCGSIFTPRTCYDYTYSGGRVTSSPAGIDCWTSGNTRSCAPVSFPEDSTVTLTATPNSGSRFSGWGGAGSGCGTALTCDVTAKGAKSVSASFYFD